MPWEKSFDQDTALDRATDLFWAQGYAATSTRELLACMGINRGSLYATFGNKQALFVQALRHYVQKYQAAMLARLEREHAPWQAIHGLFHRLVEAAAADPERRGCFLVNTALDLAPHDTEVQRLVASALDQIEAFFRRQIEAGQKSGVLAPTLDGPEVAALLLGLMLGMRVLSRTKDSAERLGHILAQVDRILG